MPQPSDALDALLDEVRAACADLRLHPALRRDWEAVRLEADVRAAHAGAALDGARVPLDRVRELAAGSAAQGAAEGVALAGLRVRAAALRGWRGPGTRVPAVPLGQLVVGLHVAGGGDGRLRVEGAPQDLRGLGPAPSGPALGAALVHLADRVGEVVGGGEPGLVVAAGTLAELSLLRPFAAGNAAVARAVFRRLLVVSGLDPTGLVVPEVAWVDAPQAHLAALAAATVDGWEVWLRHCGEAVLAGAAEGRAAAEAVASGRLGASGRPEGLGSLTQADGVPGGTPSSTARGTSDQALAVLPQRDKPGRQVLSRTGRAWVARHPLCCCTSVVRPEARSGKWWRP